MYEKSCSKKQFFIVSIVQLVYYPAPVGSFLTLVYIICLVPGASMNIHMHIYVSVLYKNNITI